MVTSDLPCNGGSFGSIGPQRQIIERGRLASHAIVIHGIGTLVVILHLEDGVVRLRRRCLRRYAREREFVRKPSVVRREGQRSRAANGEKFSCRCQLRATGY